MENDDRNAKDIEDPIQARDLSAAVALCERVLQGDAQAKADLLRKLARQIQHERIVAMRILKDLTEVAEFTGIPYTTLKSWRCEPNPLPGSPGHWDIAAILAWYEARCERQRRR